MISKQLRVPGCRPCTLLCIIRSTLGGKKLYVSPAFTKLTGWSVAEAMGCAWGDLVWPEDMPVVRQLYRTVLAEPGQIGRAHV